ncbi:PTS-dependent dihydroxyacetone kinase operon transcriptional regulator DhaR, partial [Escherichia coli]|nr:PTS-dependent dihydroxyacetone kinase operon transcriptional regulator DhaR [Escherichia coli]
MNEIEIPPLRKRREDLKQMIDDIIDKYQERTRKKMTITPDANSVLLEYRWPGNISEFKNRMEKVFINCNRLVLG